MNAFLVSKFGEDIARQISEFDDVKQTQKAHFSKKVAPWFQPCTHCKKPKNQTWFTFTTDPRNCACHCTACKKDHLSCVCDSPDFWIDPWTADNIDAMM